jgi:hypothetical protein
VSREGSATWQELQRLELAISQKQSCRQALAQTKRYEGHCEGLGLQAYPMSYRSIATYLVAYVKRNNGSAKSLSNVKSQLKTTAARRRAGWLDKTEAAMLNALVRELKLEDSGETDRKLALTTALIRDIVQQLNLGLDVDLLEATLVTVGHDALLRGGELCSGLCKEDFTWWAGGEGVSVLLNRTKTHRSGGAVKIDIPDTKSPFSAVKMLKRWWGRRRLGEKPDRTIVFPEVAGRDQRLVEGTVSLCWLRRRIKVAVAKLGLDPKRYSGHSMRAGGATDLFMARVPYFIIKRMGRWKSDAAMLYYRADEDVRRSVKRGFSKMARECGAV